MLSKLLITFSTLYSLFFVTECFAHTGDFVYRIIELTDSQQAQIDVHDGSVEDWRDIVGDPTLTALDFGTGYLWGEYNPISFDFQIWLAWHRQTSRIYVAMEQIDDDYINEFVRGWEFMEQHDSFMSLAVDGDHSGGLYRPQTIVSTELEEYDGLDRHAQQYSVLGEVFDGGSHIGLIANLMVPTWPDWYIRPPFADGGGGSSGENPTQTVTEFYITSFDELIWSSPEDSKISTLFPGKTIGLYISTVDHDGSVGETQSVHSYPNHTISSEGSTADRMGDFILVASDGNMPNETIVEPAIWSHIKHLLME